MTKVIFSQPHEHGDAAHLWCRESVDSGWWTCRLQRDDLLLEEGAVELPEGEFKPRLILKPW